MSLLEDALSIALKAHQGQTDKAGQPYILHPLRIMMAQKNEAAQVVGLLHDVVEDSHYSLDDLRQTGFSEVIIEAIACLTKAEGEDYSSYLARVENNPLARQVKLADLEDNMDIKRLQHPGEADFKRLQRYHQAWLQLKNQQT